MADTTGPISSLRGTHHPLPHGQMCDEHQERNAVARIQGETDSFGCELIDMCAECLKEYDDYKLSADYAESRKGQCDWCGGEVSDLRDRRDYEEGMAGRVYRVCGACVKRDNDSYRDED